MSENVILFDLSTKQARCFSLNPWKTRMVLNYKNIPYTSEFSAYPELGPKLKELGCPPNPTDAFAEYTSPTIRFPDGTFVADSINCAEKLEAAYPEPSLFLDAHTHESVTDAVNAVWFNIAADALPLFTREVLTKDAAIWFEEDRKQRYGMSLDELSALKGGEEMWKAVRAPDGVLEKLKDCLTKHKKDSGPFVMGSQVSYADFVIAAMFECFERCDTTSYQKIMSYDQSLKDLHQACRPWLQRDD